MNEAYGMSFLEAEAAGLPVVAGREGGVGDVVRDGISGLLSAPRDAAALARNIAVLLDDPGRRKSMGIAARDFICGERDVTNAAGHLRRLLREIRAS